MIEKSITLENISLVDFLGVENQNINRLEDLFLTSKIVSRGNEIIIKGKEEDVLRITKAIDSLIHHFHYYGCITEEHIERYSKEEYHVEATIDDVILYGFHGMPIKARTANHQKFVQTVETHDIVFVLGPAGTGKTYISVALAVKALKDGYVKKIIISRPVVEAGENLGFLPGDLKEKIDPYLRPIYDALQDMIPFEKMSYYMGKGIIEIAPLAYMRGRTLRDAFILIDEAQNTTPRQMKMVLTRMGTNAKMIITGDSSQMDLPYNQRSGLEDAVRILRHVKKIGFVELTRHDVARHCLVQDILQAYQADGSKHTEHTD